MKAKIFKRAGLPDPSSSVVDAVVKFLARAPESEGLIVVVTSCGSVDVKAAERAKLEALRNAHGDSTPSGFIPCALLTVQALEWWSLGFGDDTFQVFGPMSGGSA
jgi:hypothetical protein